MSKVKANTVSGTEGKEDVAVASQNQPAGPNILDPKHLLNDTVETPAGDHAQVIRIFRDLGESNRDEVAYLVHVLPRADASEENPNGNKDFVFNESELKLVQAALDAPRLE